MDYESVTGAAKRPLEATKKTKIDVILSNVWNLESILIEIDCRYNFNDFVKEGYALPDAF